MSQTRLSSLLETCASIAIGFIISLIVTAYLLPAYGHPVSLMDNIEITAIYTVVSIIRGYFVRRLFNRFVSRPPNVKDHRAGKLCPTSTNDMNPAPVHRLVGHLSFLKDQMTF